MPAFITRVRLHNYKSIADCDVQLGELTFVVGPNGSGKSNFLDALRLVADALNAPLDHAIRDRGGINDVRRRSQGHPNNFSIRLDFVLPDGAPGHFAFEVHAPAKGVFQIKKEQCSAGVMPTERYVVESGVLTECTVASPPAVGGADRFYLVNLSGHPAFRPVFDALSNMGFYNPVPAVIREVQPPHPGQILGRDGHNLASVLGRLEETSPAIKERVESFLAKVVPGTEGVRRESFANKETLEFRQVVQGSKAAWRFYANSMSDGTLRALAVLVALFQTRGDGSSPVPLVGIEEPESALHPYATSVLLEALQEASRKTQVIVTSHSPDLLDNKGLRDDQILAVESNGGTTTVGAVSPGAREAIRQQLYTPGELHRMHQLVQDAEVQKVTGRQLDLFEA
ncbi:MAG: AAA family ATPase [Myxococcales bacterium]|nr:AAA family ATPase [Myxococcales bacterium]MCB9544284.1 AAA family ATPase [Myxococcales bacterium]